MLDEARLRQQTGLMLSSLPQIVWDCAVKAIFALRGLGLVLAI